MVRWRINGLFNANAQDVYSEISSLETVTPKAVVDLARDENTALHPLFEWDDETAAEAYRETQARSIITSIVIEKDAEGEDGKKEKVFVRSFVSSGNRDREYKPIQSVVVQQDEYALLLARAIRELQAFKKKYQVLSSDLGWIFSAIDEMAV